MNRRQLLAAAGAGVGGLLAGCNGLGDGDGNGDGESPEGQWELDARVVNEDDQPREWRVECRSADRGSVASASSTLPAGAETELGLMGQLRDAAQEVFVESENGAIGQPWNPADCPRLFVEVTIAGGEPSVETGCERDE